VHREQRTAERQVVAKPADQMMKHAALQPVCEMRGTDPEADRGVIACCLADQLRVRTDRLEVAASGSM